MSFINKQIMSWKASEKLTGTYWGWDISSTRYGKCYSALLQTTQGTFRINSNPSLLFQLKGVQPGQQVTISCVAVHDTQYIFSVTKGRKHRNGKK